MRQNPQWILISEVRSAEAVMAVRNSISSGHNIITTIHSDKASSIPMRMYALLESNQDVAQFEKTICRYVQLGVYVKGFFSAELGRFQREILEVCEFYVDDETNEACTNLIYKKSLDGKITMNNPTKHLLDYISIQGVILPEDTFQLNNANSPAVKVVDNVPNAPAAMPKEKTELPQRAELPAQNQSQVTVNSPVSGAPAPNQAIPQMNIGNIEKAGA